jgi:hypothetical protein
MTAQDVLANYLVNFCEGSDASYEEHVDGGGGGCSISFGPWPHEKACFHRVARDTNNHSNFLSRFNCSNEPSISSGFLEIGVLININ